MKSIQNIWRRQGGLIKRYRDGRPCHFDSSFSLDEPTVTYV